MGRVALTLIIPTLGKLRQENCHESTMWTDHIVTHSEFRPG